MQRSIKLFISYATDNGLSAAFSFAITVIAARSTTLEEFGTFALALAIATLQWQVSLVGIQGVIYGRAASRPRTANALHWTGIRANLLFSCTFYGLTLAFLAFFTTPLLTLLYGLAGLKVVGGFGETLRRIYQARSEPELYVPIRITILVGAFAAAISALVANSGIWWYAAIWGSEWLAFSTILFVLTVRRGICPLTKSFRVWNLLSRAFPLFVQTLCVAVYLRFDQMYIGWRFGPDDLAIYAVAARLTEAVTLFYALISLVVSPRMIREWLAGGLSRQSLYILVMMAIGSLLASGLCFWIGDDALILLFGTPFGSGGHLLAIYILSTCFTVYGVIGSSICAAQGTTGPNLVSGLTGAISNVILTIIFCEYLGLAGAAIATVICYAVAVYILWRGAAILRRKKTIAR